MSKQGHGAVLYPRAYLAFLGAAGADVAATAAILELGGREVNPIAAWALATAGIGGMVLLKCGVVALVAWVCEMLGRRSVGAGLRLACAAVAVHAVPLTVAAVEFGRYALAPPACDGGEARASGSWAHPRSSSGTLCSPTTTSGTSSRPRLMFF